MRGGQRELGAYWQEVRCRQRGVVDNRHLCNGERQCWSVTDSEVLELQTEYDRDTEVSEHFVHGYEFDDSEGMAASVEDGISDRGRHQLGC